MVRIAIIDEKGNTVEPDELTDTGLGDIIHGCERLKDECQELYDAMQSEDDEEHEDTDSLEDRGLTLGSYGS